MLPQPCITPTWMDIYALTSERWYSDDICGYYLLSDRVMYASMASDSNFIEIPRLDLSLANSPSTEPQLLAQLRHTLVNVGFMYIENHGVPEKIITDLKSALPPLFALPEEAKQEVALSKSPHFLGYSGEGSETTAGKADQREQFEFANELEETWTEGGQSADRLRGPNAVCCDQPRLLHV